jgi:iron complex outermembrane receptor protein
MRFNKKRITVCITTTLITVSLQTAHADGAKVRPDEPGIAALPEVTVTGEKIERKLHETLTSVAVATDKDIQKHGDQTLTDIMARTPGVYTQSRNENWGIRGVPVSGFDDQGPQSLNNAISVYVDGALQSNRFITMSPLSLWDTKQVEVFRGPQSTVQGRNALAGAVVIQTADPEFENKMAARTYLGNYGLRGNSVMANGVLSEGTAAGRIAIDYQTEDGYIKNEFLDKDADLRRSLNLRSKLLILPTDNSDLMLTFAHSNYRVGDNSVNQRNRRPLYYQLFSNTDSRDTIGQNEATLKYNLYINSNWTFTSITSGTHSLYKSLLDFDQTALTADEVDRTHKTRLLNQEFRLGYTSPGLKAHVGTYYGSSQVDFADQLMFDGLGPVLNVKGDTKITTKAVFGEVNWYFTPKWQLITGLRYDRENNNSKIAYPLDPFGLAASPLTDENQSFDALLPKVGLSYKLSEAQMVGFVVQKGYRSGGVNTRALTNNRPYDAEYTTNYELSHRGYWPAQRVRTLANLYYTDWKDQQVRSIDASNNIFVSNAAKSRLSGIELTAEYGWTDKLNVFGGASYNHTEYVDFIANGDDLSGRQFIQAPRQKYNLGATYNFNSDLMWNVDMVFQDDSPSVYLTTAGQVSSVRRSDSVTLVNTNLSYKISQKITASAFIRNLFDREYITNNQNGTVLDVGAPRTFGAILRLDI